MIPTIKDTTGRGKTKECRGIAKDPCFNTKQERCVKTLVFSDAGGASCGAEECEA